MNKIETILKTKEGYYYNATDYVAFIFIKPVNTFYFLSECAGYMLKAISIDKKTGIESSYDVYSKQGIRMFDIDRIKHFISFGPGESGTPLIDDIKGPRKAS